MRVCGAVAISVADEAAIALDPAGLPVGLASVVKAHQESDADMWPFRSAIVPCFGGMAASVHHAGRLSVRGLSPDRLSRTGGFLRAFNGLRWR